MPTKWLFRSTFLFLILLELLSFWGNVYPIFNTIAFFVILFVALVITLVDLKYGLYLMAAELVIGSQGYLFAADAEGLNVSIRMGLFAVTMGVWLLRLIEDKKVEFWKSRFAGWYLALAGMLMVGVAAGLANGHSLENIFFDFNGWLFFLIVLPVYKVFSIPQTPRTKAVRELAVIVLAALAVSIFKSLILLYIFGHFNPDSLFEVYKWVRDTRVGEITFVNQNFYRIFFQSQIYSLLLAFPLLFLLFSYLLPAGQPVSKIEASFSSDGKKIAKEHWLVLIFSVFSLASVIISFSRSFWAAGALGLWLLGLYFIFVQKHYLEGLIKFVLAPFSLAVLALGLVLLVARFPIPYIPGGLAPLQSLEDRLQLLGEPAASSRWALLRPLEQEILYAPPPGLGVLIGKGFGAEVTYQTADPRILQSSPEGFYTTYAFEWGWLDIWLKIGLIGVLIYLVLLGQMTWLAFRNSLTTWTGVFGQKAILSAGLALSLIALLVTNAFTPYLNHPLGISFVIFSGVLLETWLLEQKPKSKI